MPSAVFFLVCALAAAGAAHAALFDIQRATALEAKFARVSAAFIETLQNETAKLDPHWVAYHRARKRSESGVMLSKAEMKTVRAVHDILMSIKSLQARHLKQTRQIADEHARALERAERDGELVLVAAARAAFKTTESKHVADATAAIERLRVGTTREKDEL